MPGRPSHNPSTARRRNNDPTHDSVSAGVARSDLGVAGDSRLRIGLALPLSNGYFREVAMGVARYASEAGLSPMLIDLSGSKPLPDLRSLGTGGLIIAAYDEVGDAWAMSAAVPVINVSGRRPDQPLPTVRTDDRAIGQMAAAYLIHRGYTNLACAGFSGHQYCRQRSQAFLEKVQSLGGSCSLLPETDSEDWDAQMDHLRRWLLRLTRPTAIFACNDECARRIHHFCQDAAISVPEQVSLLGVDNDPLFCLMDDPSLSTIDTASHKLGVTAARLMHEHLAQHTPIPPLTLIEPAGVIARGSTGLLTSQDPEVAAVLDVIHRRACEPVRVDDLLDDIQLSRRTIERRFRDALGCSPAQELRKVRLDIACRLLVDTDLSLMEVAHRSGFESDRLMRIVFKRQLHLSPAEYRQRFKAVTTET